MFESLIDDYQKDKKKGTESLVKACDESQDILRKHEKGFLIPFLVGTHFLTEVPPDETKAMKYLKQSMEWQPTSMGAYQLGYLLETRLRQRLGVRHVGDVAKDVKVNNEDVKEMIHWYQLAARAQEGKAMNQLGCFFLDFEHMLPTPSPLDKTPEEYLISSKEKKIPQAYTNLIRLYRKKDEYKKLVSILEEKVMLNPKNPNPLELMDLILLMLNKKDYSNYCRFIKKFQGGSYDIHALLQPGSSSVEEAECCVCLETKPCFKLVCSHVSCNNCLFEIFASPTVKSRCPICRRAL